MAKPPSFPRRPKKPGTSTRAPGKGSGERQPKHEHGGEKSVGDQPRKPRNKLEAERKRAADGKPRERSNGKPQGRPTSERTGKGSAKPTSDRHGKPIERRRTGRPRGPAKAAVAAAPVAQKPEPAPPSFKSERRKPLTELRPTEGEQRIAKLLARAGVASRRESERLIAEGRVKLDGKIVETPATLLASLKGVTVDDAPVAAAEQTRLFLFHKPTGCLTAERDPAGRKTIYDVLPKDLPRVMPIGRLDLNTEGLLLLTNDGEFKRTMELPATGVERTYRARAFGEVSQDQLEGLIGGITVDGIHYGRIDANLERRTGANQWIEMTLTEGKNREVRRVLEHLGLTVSRLIRTRYGMFRLGDLEKGEVGEVAERDLAKFVRTLEPKGGKR